MHARGYHHHEVGVGAFLVTLAGAVRLAKLHAASAEARTADATPDLVAAADVLEQVLLCGGAADGVASPRRRAEAQKLVTDMRRRGSPGCSTHLSAKAALDYPLWRAPACAPARQCALRPRRLLKAPHQQVRHGEPRAHSATA